MIDEADVPAKKPGLSWRERAAELNVAGRGLWAKYQATAAELRRVTALLEHAAAEERWAAAHPWRALARRLVSRWRTSAGRRPGGR